MPRPVRNEPRSVLPVTDCAQLHLAALSLNLSAIHMRYFLSETEPPSHLQSIAHVKQKRFLWRTLYRRYYARRLLMISCNAAYMCAGRAIHSILLLASLMLPSSVLSVSTPNRPPPIPFFTGCPIFQIL